MNKLILANPGTGKTTTLATRVIQLLKEGAKPNDILCITFTEKAANEMSQKIRLLAEEEKLDQEIQKKLSARQTDAELVIFLPLEERVGKGKAPKEMEFKAKIDAIYKTKEGYWIVDWKTDKTTENATGHRRQLATYKKLYSIANKVDEKNINTALGFIALRGKINTGKLDWKLDDQQPKPQQYETVLKYINNFVEYKKNPELFIRKPVDQPNQSILHQLTKQEAII